MKRRTLIVGLGSVSAWPVAARAQQPAMPVIGLLQIGGPSSWDFTGFRQGLKDMGYVEGQNLAIDLRWANDDPDRLPGLAADLVRRQVRVLAAFGSALAINAAKAATNTIPIVFGYGGDPVQQGLVASFNRPGGNVTGMSALSNELFGKQLGLLHELLPQASHFGFLSARRRGQRWHGDHDRSGPVCTCCSRIMVLFNDLVGDEQEGFRDDQAHRLGRLEIDCQIEFGRLNHRQVARLLAFENAPHIDAGLAIHIEIIGAVAEQFPGVHVLALA